MGMHHSQIRFAHGSCQADPTLYARIHAVAASVPSCTLHHHDTYAVVDHHAGMDEDPFIAWGRTVSRTVSHGPVLGTQAPSHPHGYTTLSTWQDGALTGHIALQPIHTHPLDRHNSITLRQTPHPIHCVDTVLRAHKLHRHPLRVGISPTLIDGRWHALDHRDGGTPPLYLRAVFTASGHHWAACVRRGDRVLFLPRISLGGVSAAQDVHHLSIAEANAERLPA